jgi:osomolarity two-component system sensor histidine kinase SLN1
MRIGIREQFAGLVLLCSLVPLAVLAVAVWINNHNFVVDITSKSLALTASLKASQIASDLLLIESTCSTIVTRLLLQDAIRSFYRGNNTSDNWDAATADTLSALASGGLSDLLQVTIFSRNQTGDPNGLFHVTADLGASSIQLQSQYANGTHVTLGDPGIGYPPELYPNITYTATSNPDPLDPSTTLPITSAFTNFSLNATSSLVLGPLQINSTFALVSLTLPIMDNTNPGVVLAFMTVVAAATGLTQVIMSREGLSNTGIVLIVSPNRRGNIFAAGNSPSSATHSSLASNLALTTVKYSFPPVAIPGQPDRHSQYNANLSKFGSSNFSEQQYPAVLAAFSKQNIAINNASSMLSTHNENNVSVAVGYARPQTKLVDWLVIIEQSHDEAWAPINKLRTIVLACVFGAIGLVILVIVPVAHLSVRPIRRLRDATEKSIAPPGYSRDGSLHSDQMDDPGYASGDGAGDEEIATSTPSEKKRGFLVRLGNIGRGGRLKTKTERSEEDRRKVFKIPAEVPDRKHWITDEVSELTTTFNAMSRELLLQYTSLEEKVAERTAELELSKKAAEAANESKTLFIANISHELKTPLNGILGMCAVCMGEDDLPRIKRSLQIVYKSGDLLLHLLNDLLTFSKNQIGQQLSLEEKEFRLVDIKSQITTIFDKQVRDAHINFNVKFIGTDAETELEFGDGKKKLPALGPHGMGRLKDMSLWGDQHRILQVIINLVSNSLKFTPEGGTVEVRIKCLGEIDTSSGDGNSRNSLGSKHRGRNNSGSNTSQTSRKSSLQKKKKKTAGTALLINPMDPSATPRVQVRERSPTPPPLNAKNLLFQFEVQDTGPGIPANFQERVFEPFVQGDLGLSKSKPFTTTWAM